MEELLAYEPLLYGGGVFRVKHISTKSKKYYAMFSYRSVVIVHPRAYKRRSDAYSAAERIVGKLRTYENKKAVVEPAGQTEEVPV